MNENNAKELLSNFLSNNYLTKYCHASFEQVRDEWVDGKCIVMSSGGIKYLTNAYLNIRYIRDILHSTMPIQVWYLGEKEKINSIFDDLSNRYQDIEFIDALEFSKTFPFAKLAGWENKIYAMAHCKYSEILYLDSDCFLDYRPEELFENLDEYKEFGAVFSADCDIIGCHRPMDENGVVNKLGTFRHGRWDYSRPNPLLSIFDIPDNNSPELESGFIVINKKICYKEVILSLFFNENSNFIYDYIYGDKDTYRLAWSYFNTKYFVIKNVSRSQNCITNFYKNKMLFQHRVQNTKFDINVPWNAFPNNVSSFQKLDQYKCFFDDLLELTREFTNIYSDDTYIFDKMSNNHTDTFIIKFLDENHYMISRSDSDEGWGQDLTLRIIDKTNNKKNIVRIGSSNHNNIVKTL